LKWIFDTAFEDHELVQFFENILGFCRSSASVVDRPLDRLYTLGKDRLSQAVTRLLDRTWSSNFDLEKTGRLVVCVKVADAVRLSDAALSILKDIFPWDRHKVLQSVEVGQSLRTPGSTTDQKIDLCAHSIVAGIIANVQESDAGWIALAAGELNKQEDVIRGYIQHGNDSVLLANLIHITRLIFDSLGDPESQDMAVESSYILPFLSDSSFDIRNTLPGLQYDFLTLWHDIEREAQRNNEDSVVEIQEYLRHLYLALSQGTHNTSTTPSVADTNSSRHPPDSPAPMDGAVDDENAHTHTTPPISHHDTSRTAVPGRNTPDPADGLSSPDNFTDGMQRITEAAAPPHSTSEPLEALGLPTASRDIPITDDATQRMTADISSRDQPNPRPNPSRSFRADSHSRFDSAMVSSEYLAHALESSSPASTSAPSPATLRVASQLPP
jgi:hypothetical protein